MKQRFYIGVFILTLFFSGISPVFAASDLSSIKLQIIVDESMLPKKCNIDFDTIHSKLSQSTANNCQFDSDKIFEQATRLAKQGILRPDDLQIVTVTITAP